MPTYGLYTVELRLEARLQWAEKVAAGKSWDISAAIRDLQSPEKWIRNNSSRTIRGYLRGLDSLARAKLKSRLSANQCERFRTVVAAENELLQTLEALGFRHPAKIREIAVRPWA